MDIFALSNIFLKLAGTWGGIVSGEWWIHPGGQAEFADGDIGDSGHEAIAIDSMIDSDVLIEALREYYSNNPADFDEDECEIYLSKLDRYGLDYNSNSILNGDVPVPNEVGIAVVGDAEKWSMINADARQAYMKYNGAIRVIGVNFEAWNVTNSTIRLIQDFLLDEQNVGEQTAQAIKNTEIYIEKISSSKWTNLPLADFLEIDNVRDLWSLAQAS